MKIGWPSEHHVFLYAFCNSIQFFITVIQSQAGLTKMNCPISKFFMAKLFFGVKKIKKSKNLQIHWKLPTSVHYTSIHYNPSNKTTYNNNNKKKVNSIV